MKIKSIIAAILSVIMLFSGVPIFAQTVSDDDFYYYETDSYNEYLEEHDTINAKKAGVSLLDIKLPNTALPWVIYSVEIVFKESPDRTKLKNASFEKLYDTNIYGSVKDGKIVLDNNKFRSIMDEHNIYTQKMCEYCYAKWNCGGGCRLFYQSFSNEYVMPKCRFTKESLRIELFYMWMLIMHFLVGQHYGC